MKDGPPSSPPIGWTGDLDDDCTAVWEGLMLRAESMDRQIWWWAVYLDEGRGEEIGSSNNGDRVCRSGKSARMLAEECAVAFVKTGRQDGPR